MVNPGAPFPPCGGDSPGTAFPTGAFDFSAHIHRLPLSLRAPTGRGNLPIRRNDTVAEEDVLRSPMVGYDRFHQEIPTGFALGMTGSGDCAFILLGRFRRLVGGVRQHPTKYSPNSIRRADHSDQSSEPKGCHSTTRPPERIVSGDSPPGRIRQQIPHKIPGFLRRKSLTNENILL